MTLLPVGKFCLTTARQRATLSVPEASRAPGEVSVLVPAARPTTANEPGKAAQDTEPVVSLEEIVPAPVARPPTRNQSPETIEAFWHLR